MVSRNRLVLLAILVACLAGATMLFMRSGGEQIGTPTVAGRGVEKPVLGLMTTLPLYWPEADDPGDLLRNGGEVHWARSALEQDYVLKPLDTLSPDGGLNAVRYLLLAQPRALGGEENVSLDRWVRGGGRLLLFADPMLTGQSVFAIGDRRRPQDVVLISPILARWGLELTFDENQPGEPAVSLIDGIETPVHLAGTFRLQGSVAGTRSRCRLLASGLAARCPVGKGSVLAIADAALFEGGEDGDGRSGPLMRLAAMAFAGN